MSCYDDVDMKRMRHTVCAVEAGFLVGQGKGTHVRKQERMSEHEGSSIGSDGFQHLHCIVSHASLPGTAPASAQAKGDLRVQQTQGPFAQRIIMQVLFSENSGDSKSAPSV